jgi:neutral ceramidase
MGYFNDRISEGVTDPLFCRLAALEDEAERVLLVQLDSCLVEAADAALLKREIERVSGYPADSTMVFTSHTHTAPALASFYAVRREEQYLVNLVSRVAAACASLGPPSPVQVTAGRSRAPGLASNRRWYLTDGRVATNPPRMHPALLRPEGLVDEEVTVLGFAAPSGEVRAVLVSVSNHTDTTGGNRVSADWPGVMEQEMRAALGPGVVVLPVIGAAGNINHFDFLRALDQTSRAEAVRLGTAYARAARAALACGRPVPAAPLGAASRTLTLPGREITAAETERARAAVSRRQAARAAADLTSEDIFRGDPEVERIFGQRLLDLAARGPVTHEVPLQLLRLGGIGLFGVPGEPFVEIGLALKALAGFSAAVPVGLANGYFGYIPLPECFDRGGYEVRAGSALLCRDAAPRILEAFREMAADS